MPLYNDITKPAPPLPSAESSQLDSGVTLLPPLSRRGHGPGLIVVIPDHDKPVHIHEGVPSILIKWAEEGYAVVEIQQNAIKSGATSAVQKALKALADCDRCTPKDKIGLVAYGPDLWNGIADKVASEPSVVAVAVYGGAFKEKDLTHANVPAVFHLAGTASGPATRIESLTTYYYESVTSQMFAIPFQHEFDYPKEAISHTRNLQLLKKHMQGPYFDLEHIWDEHTYYEFADRSVEHTMSTMVQEPYVNHLPVLTGGVGRDALTGFYSHNFIFNNSADTTMELVSRSIAIDRIIDEFVFKFTHDRELDWLIPGIPPTGLYVEVPFTAVVNVRGDRLYHEHISWDQGTVLRQLGLLPEYLTYPYPLPDGRQPGPGKRFEYKVPVPEGTDAAKKLRNRDAVPSNQLFQYQIREVSAGTGD